MTGLVSVDHCDDYVMQLKTQQQRSHPSKRSIMRLSNNKSEGKQLNYRKNGKDGCYMQSAVALFVQT